MFCSLGLMQVLGLGPRSLTPDWLPNHHHLSQNSWLTAYNTSNMSSLHMFAHTVPSAWKVTASMVFQQQHTCLPSESQLKYDLSWRRLLGTPSPRLFFWLSWVWHPYHTAFSLPQGPYHGVFHASSLLSLLEHEFSEERNASSFRSVASLPA